jgi:hypothetical protein
MHLGIWYLERPKALVLSPNLLRSMNTGEYDIVTT